jgi:hypothetical protein
MVPYYEVISFLIVVYLATAICGVCKEGESAVQLFSIDVESNGCSKPSFIQVSGEEDFTYCCDRHDACYSTCGASQKFCDEDFKKCMLKLCATTYASNPQCSNAASTYAMGTMMFGSDGYQQTQNQYCACLPKGQSVIEHYQKGVKEFYIRHNMVEKAEAAHLVVEIPSMQRI